ncbi:MAG: GTP-binding protein, partial [Clostridia bacterium]|nr:GTP-binding protein [Clostridia bacterium]
MENKMLRRSVVGILAHVDAGKTTLSEAMLYSAGELRTMGRVDHGNAFLDNFNLERARGITIFSKQACLNLDGLQATLLDTPGHVDFSPEMERTLNVLDAAILVISAPAGVQSHTLTVWKLLREHNIPTFIFVNKTDLPGKTREEVMEELKTSLGEGCTDIYAGVEEKAMADEILLGEYLETGTLQEESVVRAIREARLFPCWFGAALKLAGVEEFLEGLRQYLPETEGEEPFSARVYKITRDPQGTRLTHMKVTGGSLKVRETLNGADFEEKITALRVYAGAKFKTIDVAYPGDVVAAVGLTRTAPGMSLGAEAESMPPTLEPVLTYRVILPPEMDAHRAMMQFRELEEEEPQLHVDWNSRLAELRVRIMGEVQLEVLHELVKERFGYEVR